MQKRAVFGAIYAACIILFFGVWGQFAPFLMLFFSFFVIKEGRDLIAKAGMPWWSIWYVAMAPLVFTTYHAKFHPEVILFVFVGIWSSDSFAYLVGRAVGKTPLAPKISPNKTVEGLIGGIFFTLATAYFYNHWFPITTVYKAMFMGVSIAIFAPLGDLWMSSIKRRASVKDSGVFLPGHGGALDRLDSFITAGPMALLIYLLL